MRFVAVKTKLRGGGPRSLITPHLFRLDECCWQSPDQPEFRVALGFLGSSWHPQTEQGIRREWRSHCNFTECKWFEHGVW